ncbi:putative transcriptional regulator [Treponema sp. JC4]|uniref:helix-turn-helix transcriptional regulator n=1 Tax=Treponema sp. JC4 TaxID=1124982 RepID=UPI00025AFB26|nr:helix-turn-helix transcriptional regulator [Treponema sp. JC4]EID86089.1 putative transcriptional regulator [Treponema sp. JC4]
MKEILKYLRQLNSLSQEEVAQKLGISRQSYIKYEKGSVIPNTHTLSELAKLYSVKESFIIENKIPSLEKTNHEAFLYKTKEASPLTFAEPQIQYGTTPRKVYDGIFDGDSIKILDSRLKSKLKAGQHIRYYIEDESEELKRRKEAVKNIQAILAEVTPCYSDSDDPYYKKALEDALNEKYNLN